MHTPRLNAWKLTEPNVSHEYMYAPVVAESKNVIFETDSIRK